MKRIAVLGVAIVFFVLAGLAIADTYGTNFESFTLGSVDGQDGWGNSDPNVDAAIVSNATYPSFATRQLRMSNAFANGGFGGWVASKTLAEPAGQTGATDGNTTAGPWKPYFEASWDFASTNPAAQQVDTTTAGCSPTCVPNAPAMGNGSAGCSVATPCPLQLFASPIRHSDFSRTDVLKMEDAPDGLAVIFEDYQSGASGTACDDNNFIGTVVASGLDRSVPHNLKITIQYVDGADNDIVRIYVDGVLKHTGTTWEGVHTDCGDVDTGETIDRVLFYVRSNTSCITAGDDAGDCGGSAPALAGGGFLIDNFSSRSASPATVSKAFMPDTVNAADSSTMKFTVINPNTSTDLHGVGFTDDLSTTAPGVTVKSPPNLTSTCGNVDSSGSLTATAGDTSVSLANAVIKAGDTCTFTVDVTTSSGGSKTNQTSAIDSSDGGIGVASNLATLTVNAATPSISTLASAGAVGSPMNDVATVSGGASPTGNVTFALFSDIGCNTQVFTSTNMLSAGSATSGSYTPTAVGTYYWTAVYNGDTSNNTATSSCNADSNEVVTVGKASPTLTTQASAGGTMGTSVNDVATISGGSSPTGTVTFDLFSDNACSTQIFTSTNAVASGSATSGSFALASAGTYYWTAAYSGDANNNAATSVCNAANESVTIAQASVNVITQNSRGGQGGIHSTAYVLGGSNPTGTVTFRVFTDSGCTHQVFSSTNPLSVGGLLGRSATSSAYSQASPRNNYYWRATYNGDANNAAASSICSVSPSSGGR